MKLLMLMAASWAQEHGAEAEVVIPWNNLFVQAFNLFVLLALLTYLLRHSVKAHFSNRAQEYRELVDRAEAARREAEDSRNQIKFRLAKLESGASENLTLARKEGEELRQRLLTEATTLTAKLDSEAKRSALVELDKAKAETKQ